MKPEERRALLAALAWQIEAGADEALEDAPLDRAALAAAEPPAAPAAASAAAQDRPAAPASARASPPPAGPAAAAGAGAAENPLERSAREIAAACGTLAELETALGAFEGVALKAGARCCVFADGLAGARVMAIGEAPGREEDLAGRPFVGRSGRLLDRMLGAIGLDRRAETPERGVYITNLLPWRPVRNRTPAADEAAALRAFLLRHVELAAPEFILLLGAPATRALLGVEEGILRLRGRWRRDGSGRPVLPTLHPAYLLRSPEAKRLAWRDMMSLRAALDGAALEGITLDGAAPETARGGGEERP